MRKLFIMASFMIALMFSTTRVHAQESVEDGGIIVYNEDAYSKTRAIPTDVQSVTMTQVGVQIIPETPIKEELVKNAEVIYRFRYKVTAKLYNGKTVTGKPIDRIWMSSATNGQKFTNINSAGVGYIDIDVRGVKNIDIYCYVGTARSNTVHISSKVKAQYEKTFYCTAYTTVLENDYNGTKVPAPGIADATFKQDFLEATKLNGSGKASSGKYLHYNSGTSKYEYSSPQTATGTTPQAGKTIAVDPYYIPRARPSAVWKRATVSIAGVGNRVAEDGGGAITGYRIDVYAGVGKSSLVGWTNGYRKVTLLSIG